MITKENKMMCPDIMNVTEAAEYLRLSVSLVYQEVQFGKIPHIRKGRRILFLRDDLRSWLSAISTKQGALV